MIIKIKNERQFGTNKGDLIEVKTELSDYYIGHIISQQKKNPDAVRVSKKNCQIVSSNE